MTISLSKLQKLYLLTLLQLVSTPSAAESWVYAGIMRTVGCDNWEESKLDYTETK